MYKVALVIIFSIKPKLSSPTISCSSKKKCSTAPPGIGTIDLIYLLNAMLTTISLGLLYAKNQVQLLFEI